MTLRQRPNATRATNRVTNRGAGDHSYSIATRTPRHTASADTSRSYVTHLIEDGFDPRFAQEQAGHEHASTTSIYTKSRELHQTGEKPQVTRSAWRGSGASNSCVAAA
ncbi:MAG: tyrosine-type recombinase/integrase [Pseudonocardiaceae bacterium]